MALEFKPASRKAVPQLISIASVSGGGKTYSALLVARGLAGPKGTVAFIDAENGRGEMYADSPGILAAYKDHPNRIYNYIRLDPPFTPARYVEYIEAAENSGAAVGILDSASHIWDGMGGCVDMAEKNKGMWNKPKLEHKKFVNRLLSSRMHWILCLRAQEKVKIFAKGDPVIISHAQADDAARAPTADKTLIVPIGLQPICEKHLVFEMTVRLLLDEQSHFSVPSKVPEPLLPLFPGGRLLTVEDGARIREWNEGGAVADQFEQLRKRARAVAGDGLAPYKAFFASLTGSQKRAITEHDENKQLAMQADAEREDAVPVFEGMDLPDAMNYAPGDECWYIEKAGAEKKRLRVVVEEGEANKWAASPK